MDKSVRQTLGTFDLWHSSHMWIQTMLSCVKNSTTMQIRVISRFWFCRRPWRLEVNIRWNSVYIRKSHVRVNKLDVQETDISLTQFNKAEIISLDAGLRMNGIPALDFWHLVIEVFHSRSNQTNKTKDVTYIHNTSEHRQKCHVEHTAQHCRLALFQDSEFAGGPCRFEINIGRNSVYLRKPNIRSHKLGV